MHQLLLLLPVVALALFLIFPWPVAMILYLPILLGSIFAYRKAWKALKTPPTTGEEAMLGQTAVVLQADNERIEVQYQGEIWQAVSDVSLHVGQEVIIRHLEGLVLFVTPATDIAEGMNN